MIYAVLCVVLLYVAYFSYKYAWWTGTVEYAKPRVLMYHMVSKHKKGTKFNGLRVPPHEFEKQVQYLAQNDWQFVTMSELTHQSLNGEVPEKTVAITFDDGYADNYTNALPILKKYHAKATIYLVVDRHDREWSSKRKKKNNTGELKQEPKLNDEQVLEMIDSGLIEIGSHTMTHDNLPTLSLEQKQTEITASKQVIENTYNIPCHSFCYPFGLYDEQDVQLVKAAGYSNATTTEKGIENIKVDNLFKLQRITISGKDDLFVFKIKMKRGLKGLKK